MDCTEAGKETCNKFGVRGYPTLKIFKGGEMSQEYNGPREASEYNVCVFEASDVVIEAFLLFTANVVDVMSN